MSWVEVSMPSLDGQTVKGKAHMAWVPIQWTLWEYGVTQDEVPKDVWVEHRLHRAAILYSLFGTHAFHCAQCSVLWIASGVYGGLLAPDSVLDVGRAMENAIRLPELTIRDVSVVADPPHPERKVEP